MSDPAFSGASPAVSNDVAVEVANEIGQVLERIPLNDRVGFLFGLVVGLLDSQGMTEIQVRGEIVKGLSFIYGRQKSKTER